MWYVYVYIAKENNDHMILLITLESIMNSAITLDLKGWN